MSAHASATAVTTCERRRSREKRDGHTNGNNKLVHLIAPFADRIIPAMGGPYAQASTRDVTDVTFA
ncbi:MULTISPECIES: hypothetical protein [Bradyrhizobium]|uniref:hypothetical protein n=1 Tax=Bradyrhizobium TaxID=374 RepID=UPI000FE14B85|nr:MULTISPECIES: hypothetical protein [Bradyrhizobium]